MPQSAPRARVVLSTVVGLHRAALCAVGPSLRSETANNAHAERLSSPPYCSTMRRIVLLLIVSLPTSLCAQRILDTDSLERQLTQRTTGAERLSTVLALGANLEHARPERSKALAFEALSLAQAAKDHRRMADAVELAAGASAIMGDTSYAINVLEKAIALRKALKDERATARCWARLGLAYHKARRLAQAADAYDRCIDIAVRTQDSETQAIGLMAYSTLRQDEGKTAEMMAMALKADSIYRPEQPTLTRARVLQCLGNAHLGRGEPDTAFTVLTRAREQSTAVGSAYWTAVIDLHLAYAHSDRGDYTRTGEQGQLALAAFERLGAVRDQPITNHLLGYTYWQVLPDSVTYRYFIRGRTLADSLGMLRQRTNTDLVIGKFLVTADSTMLRSIGIRYPARFDSAEVRMLKGLGTAHALGDRPLEGIALNALGALENYRPDLRKALVYHQRYLDLQRTFGDNRLVAAALLGIGNDHLLLGDPQKAIIHLNEALTIASANGLNELKVYILRDLYEANKRAGSTSLALAHLERWKALNDSLNNTGLAQKLTAQQLTNTFQKKQLADSLQHVQEIALEQQAARSAVERHRSRTIYLVSGALTLLAAGGVAFALDRKRRRERFTRRTLQLEMQALRAQMNPHFLFNALASINGFIGRQDTATAKDFVARFAKLTRMVLENSRHTEVPLATDLKALQLYLELEQVRTENKFDYRIDIDPQLDVTDVHVPPLVLQPLVENAIWHGVAHKEDRGTIIVSASQRDGLLVLGVEDDGIGRNNKGNRPNGGDASRTSLGTTITRSRLDLLGQQKGRATDLRYIDIPSGTKVELILPT